MSSKRFQEFFAGSVQGVLQEAWAVALTKNALSALVKCLEDSGFRGDGIVTAGVGPMPRGGYCQVKQGAIDPNGARFSLSALLLMIGPGPGIRGECTLQFTASTEAGELLIYQNVATAAITNEAISEKVPRIVIEDAVHDCIGQDLSVGLVRCARTFEAHFLEAMTP